MIKIRLEILDKIPNMQIFLLSNNLNITRNIKEGRSEMIYEKMQFSEKSSNILYHCVDSL